MTLDELKAFKAKCDEVQSTIKRDIAYIEKDIAVSEDRKLRDFEELCGKLQELVGLLPEGLPRHFGTKEREEVIVGDEGGWQGCGTLLTVKAGNLYKNDFTWNGTSVYAIDIYFGNIGCNKINLMIEKNRIDGHHMYKDWKVWLASNADIIYDMAKNAVADCHRDYNNWLVEQNKALLDKAEELREEEI